MKIVYFVYFFFNYTWHYAISWSVLTPYYTEDVLFSLENLEVENEDGVSILFYLQKIFPGLPLSCWYLNLFPSFFLSDRCWHTDEWNNFLERMNCGSEDDFKDSDKLDELRLWASFRGQTLTKTGIDFVFGCIYGDYVYLLTLPLFLMRNRLPPCCHNH